MNSDQSEDTPVTQRSPFSPEFGDPLFLHHSDQYNFKLSTELLNDYNFYQWRRSVEIVLVAKNKIGFVNGQCKAPDPSTNREKYLQWQRCDNMVLSWILHSVEKDIAKSLFSATTSSQLWKEIEVRYANPNSTRQYQLQKELFNISQDNLSVTGYFTKFKQLWDEYIMILDYTGLSQESIDAVQKFLSKQQVIQFLVGLNDSYKVARGNALMMKPAPRLDEVYNLILQEEKQRELKNIPNLSQDSIAAVARG